MNLSIEDFLLMGIKKERVIQRLPFLNKYLKEFEVNNPDRLIYYFANIFHETGDYKFLKELSNGKDYEGRAGLGNTQPGDGQRFIGRGDTQTTGRSNYSQLTIWYRKRFPNTKHNFVSNPELLETPEFAVLSSFWYWDTRNLNKLCDKQDFLNVCSVINTGKIQDPKKPHKINGLKDREAKKIIVEAWLKKLILG